MAAARGRQAVAVTERLLEAPYEFDFFQAVRLLEQIGRGRSPEGSAREPVGRDRPPHQEAVRFRGHVSHSFPVGEVHSIKTSDARPLDAPECPPPEMVVAFMGMIGPNAALPQHYTRTVIERLRSHDYALRDFLDLFHHRAVSLFFRAWDKYRVTDAYARSAGAPDREDHDLFMQALRCLVGRGTGGQTRRLDFSDEQFVQYAGYFSRPRPQAVALGRMLSSTFGVPVEVCQFQGEWLYLSEDEQSTLPTFEFPDGRNNILGRNVLVGERVWNVQSKFRLRVGPIDAATAWRFLPTGDLLKPFCQLTRSYVGVEFDFDVQLSVFAAHVPGCQLGGTVSRGSQLGWNTWLHSGPMTRDADDAIFVDEGLPTR